MGAPSNVVEALLAAMTPSLKQVADDTGLNYETLRHWASRGLYPAPDKMDQLAEAAEEQARRLYLLALETRTEATSRR